MSNDKDKECREAFIDAGYWPNEVLWKVWSTAWRLGRESARPEALRSEEDGAHLYCTTCGSCGEDGCCPPEKCQKARRSEIIEECAKICEQRALAWDASVREGSEQRAYEETVLMECAAAMRRLETFPSPLARRPWEDCMSESQNCRKNNPDARDCCAAGREP